MSLKKILVAVAPQTLPKLEHAFANRDKFDLTVTHDGLDAYRIIEEERPDLVFMDIFMPGMNGDACCLSVKRSREHNETGFVLLAYAGREEDLERCRRALCDDIVTKPIDSEHLSAVIYQLLFAQQKETHRYKVRLAIFYGQQQQHLLTDYAINLSTGGVFVETSQILPVGAPLTVDFMLSDAAPSTTITCNARVAWTNSPEAMVKPFLPPGIGLQFIDLSLDDIHKIRDFLNSSDLIPTW